MLGAWASDQVRVYLPHYKDNLQPVHVDLISNMRVVLNNIRILLVQPLETL
jgi:hypothetical protein